MAKSAEFWEQVKNHFIFGYPEPDGRVRHLSYKQLAAIHGVSDVAILKQSKKDNWVRITTRLVKKKADQNKKLADKINAKLDTIVENRAGDLAIEYLEFDIKCVKLSQQAIDIIQRSINALAAKYQAEGKDFFPERQLEGYLKALEKAQLIGKNAVGKTMANQPRNVDNRQITFVTASVDQIAQEVKALEMPDES